jgi:hypothetical protein
VVELTPWRVQGEYVESCNCEAICPCRMIGGVPGGCRYDDDEPGSPWSLVLYLDETGGAEQRAALESIFLGAIGGERILRLPWVRKPSFVIDVRPSRLEFDGESVRVEDRATLRATRRVETDDDVRCVIPGYEEPGYELYADELAVHDDPFGYALTGNCAYRSAFHYTS